MSFIIRGPVAPLRGFASGAFLLLACATLCGCNDIAANPPSADGQAQFVRRDDANMAAATVAIVSVDGAPADLSAHFNQSLETAAAGRGIAVVDPAKARYLVRGYLTAYDAKHSVKAEGNKKATLILGADDFPFPIPLVNSKSGWEFDAAAGRLEILYRRIGRNELDAIQTSLAFVDAQNEYAEKDRTGGGVGVYAQRVVSSPGKKDGLYWRDDRDPSPLGELAAQASAEGYRAGEQAAPYHGYYFRILKGQGPDAPGGAFYYVVKGKMIGGFALIAYPAEYRSSGVMTFVITDGDIVYEKDLGANTTAVARVMTAFRKDGTWHASSE